MNVNRTAPFVFPEGRRFEHVEAVHLGDALTRFAGQSELFTGLNFAELALLAGYLEVYRARSGDVLVKENEPGDFMLLVIEGEIDILKEGLTGQRQRMSTVGAGRTVGEMSMIDGAPRFATCIAARLTTFAILTREQIGRMIADQPALACKILVNLVAMLSARLRHTTAQLMNQIAR
ncbi:MAG TPA: cyclic nucleotide-binding domain-containing protein [Burkholderiales bacterium]|nr:cyclic nucleotide-binding domain-containing protein [Burkholderiales bacterium]